MKKLIAAAVLAVTLTGCTSYTSFGPCVGIFTMDEKKPDLYYKLSIWNVAMGVLFIETLVAPAVVIADNLYCPEGKR